MNERIALLKSQCIVREMRGTTAFDSYMVDRFDTEKFAELIVREMLQTCEDHPAWTGRMIGEQIKEHFGVEE
jgi:hypothetical protein